MNVFGRTIPFVISCSLLLILSALPAKLCAARNGSETVLSLKTEETKSVAAQHIEQVADPEEEEDPHFILIEPLSKPEFSKPEQVIDFVHSALDVQWEWSGKAPNVVVVRNAGSHYKPNANEASYDDLILIVKRDEVIHFAYGNAEGTEHRTYVNKYGYTKYTDPAIGKTMTPALDAGQYRFKVALHSGSYKALHLYSWDFERFGLPSQRRNGRYGKYEVGAVNLHKGGSTWNWSIGCLTIHYARWDKFIKHFEMGSWGRLYLVGQWNGLYTATAANNKKAERLRRARLGQQFQLKLDGPLFKEKAWPFFRAIH